MTTLPVKATAQRGQVCIELPEPHAYGLGFDGLRSWASVTLTIEQADELWNVIQEAQLVAMEQRARARTARMGNARDVSLALAEHTAHALSGGAA